MMMQNKDICAFPDCGKELTHKEGRKKRKYCSPACGRKDWGRINYKPSDKPKKFKTIPIEQWEDIQKKLAGKGVDDNRDNALTNAARGRDKSGINEDELKPEKGNDVNEIKDRIAQLQSELKSPPKNPLIGLKNWKLIREKELTELKNKFLTHTT